MKESTFQTFSRNLTRFYRVPAVVDLASLRKAMNDVGGDINKINPEVPVDLVIDHSVQVDSYEPTCVRTQYEIRI